MQAKPKLGGTYRFVKLYFGNWWSTTFSERYFIGLPVCQPGLLRSTYIIIYNCSTVQMKCCTFLIHLCLVAAMISSYKNIGTTNCKMHLSALPTSMTYAYLLFYRACFLDQVVETVRGMPTTLCYLCFRASSSSLNRSK